MFLHQKTIASVLLGIGITATAASVLLQPEALGAQRTATETQRSKSSRQPAGGSSKAVKSPTAEQAATSLKYGDGGADGKQSLGGSGEMIKFSAPLQASKVTGIRIHASRYGEVQPPKENFLIFFLDEDLAHVLHTEMA